MPSSDKPIANPVAVLREEFDDWAVLFNPDTAEALGVNPTGVLIWKLLDGKNSLDQIAEDMGQHFEDVPDCVADEVRAFVTMLGEKGFVGKN